MRPVDAFLRSVRTAFRPEEQGDWTGWLWLLLVVVVLVSLLVLGRMRARRKAGREEEATFARWVTEKGLVSADEQLIRRMAARIAVAPLLVGTHLDVFERATAAELAAAGVPAAGAPPEGVFARVGQLRRSLSFHVLSEQVPLVSTREFASGVRGQFAGIEGMVGEVNEAWFDVEAAADAVFAALSVDRPVRVTFVRGGEARYVARCTLVSATPPHAPRRLVLRHDEQPERVQKRNAVRVTVHGPVDLRSRVAEAGTPVGTDDAVAHGELVDLSIGGMALSTESKLKVGSSLRASFDWEGGAYRDLPVLVLQCAPRSRGLNMVRLEFKGLPAAEENRLAAAIARQTAHTHHEAPPE